MTLPAGRTLGHYEIVSSLGAGGMGEVYRARDTRLGREVAIKLLLEEVANDPERLARFEREARVLASLNHPRIATLHGFESDGATRFLVMELVEGETLADRISRGPIPVEETIALFLEIAEGLEAAHERGVVHRDFKPANVKVTAQLEGAFDHGSARGVKILDFGLAKAMEEEATAGSAALSHSPTLTLAATQRGQILGTAAYMSPQQAQGQPVDRRADIWAFGVCLFEALTAERAFAGENASLVLASVLKDEPDWGALPAETPPALRRLLRRCLEKSARARLPHIGAARLELEEARVEARAPRPSASATRLPPSPTAQPGDASAETRAREPRRRSAAIALGLVLSFALGAGAVYLLLELGVAGGQLPGGEPAPSAVSRSPLRYTVDLSEIEPRMGFDDGTVRVSPDGALIAITAGVGPGSRVYLRRRGSLELQPVAGTHGAWYTQFSPDGQWLLFGLLSQPGLRRVRVSGGAPLAVLDGEEIGIWGFDWDTEDRIVYTTSEGLRRAPVSGGEVEVLTETTRGDIDSGVQHRFPDVLPRGRGVVFTAIAGARLGEASVAIFDSGSGRVRTLVEGAYHARYAATGHLVYASEGGVYAVPFDLDRLELAGAPARVLDDVLLNATYGLAYFSFSEAGTLVYLSLRTWGRGALSLSWVDRDGRTERFSVPPGHVDAPRFSPDGRAVALRSNNNLVVMDLGTGRLTQVTREGHSEHGIWTADGKSVVYASQQAPAPSWDLYRREVGGSEAAQRLAGDSGDEMPTSVHGDTLLYHRDRQAGGFDIYTLDLEDPAGSVAALVRTEAHEANGQFSPDGRWIAYEIWEEGVPEVWVEPYPVVGRRRKISQDGGYAPVWSPAGAELFYVEGGRRMMSVRYAVAGDGSFVAEAPELLFERAISFSGYPRRVFDVTPDGQRFLVLDAPDTSGDHLVVVENWFAELERLVPVK